MKVARYFFWGKINESRTFRLLDRVKLTSNVIFLRFNFFDKNENEIFLFDILNLSKK